MMMRKSIAVLLSALALTFGAPITGIAQAPTSNLRGQIVDAGGRGATGMRVELVSDRHVLATTISTTDGHFNFAGVPAGSYVVRTTVNGQPTGVRVSVIAGQSVATALLVLPSLATAAPAVVMAALGPALGALTAAAVTVVGNTIVIQAAKQEDEAVLITLVNAANQYIAELNAQLPPPPPGTPPPFQFIPTAPLSGQ
jgi:hypothetical protein